MSNDTMEDYVKKIVTPIFEKELSKGNSKNSMGVVSKGGSVKIYWRPNNYRLLIPFNKKNFKEHSPKKPRFLMELKIANYGSKHIFRIGKGTTIVIDKDNATLIYSLKDDDGKPLWYEIESENLEQVERYCLEQKENIKKLLIRRLKEIIRLHKGSASFNEVEWQRYEDAVKGDEILDNLPTDRIIYATTFKKVYEDDVEFIGKKKEEPTQKMINYIDNQALERQSPKILSKLSELNNNHAFLTNAVKDMAEQNKLLYEGHELLKKNIESHIRLTNNVADVVKELYKPFFVRWYGWLKKVVNKIQIGGKKQ